MQQISRLESGTQTADGTGSGTYTFPKIRGKLLKIEITCSASTGFRAYEILSDGSALTYILGGAASYVTVATASSFYPMKVGCGTDGVDFATEITRSPNVIFDRQIKVDATSLTIGDTWDVNITYET
jgi:hypothetical protein